MNVLDNACDSCDAILSDAEIAAGERFGQQLCDQCAAGYAAVNPQHPDARTTMHNDDDTDARIPVAETVQAMMLAGDADWLADAIEHAMETGDALYLLAQCRRHIEPARQAEEQKALDSRREGAPA